MMRVTPLLSPGEWIAWRTLQLGVSWVGTAIFLSLLVAPHVGIHAFWNVLIPVAPALVALLPGLWRNVCPLGSASMLSRHFGVSACNKLPRLWRGRFALIGVGLLYLIVPLRHVVLDTNGPATAMILSVFAVLAVFLGLWFEWKSGWCSGLCPVHPVEKLYGSKPLASFPNAHCHECDICVAVCPDATAEVSPFSRNPAQLQPVVGVLMVGGFSGFIWGWFHVPDYSGLEGWRHLPFAYGMPLAGLAATLLTYLLLERVVPSRHRRLLQRIFAAAAISCYYWYRLPAFFGFGPFPGDGMLFDLRATLPYWFPLVSRIMTTTFFFWWLVGRTDQKRAWLVRPPFARHPRTNTRPTAE